MIQQYGNRVSRSIELSILSHRNIGTRGVRASSHAEVERAVMRDGEEGCALRLQRAQIWPELPRRLARAPPPGEGGSGSGGGDPAAGGRREGGRGRSRNAELTEHIEKLRHGLPDGDGWASLAAVAAGRGRASTWVQGRTSRPDDGLARDGRRRATKSHRRRANYY